MLIHIYTHGLVSGRWLRLLAPSAPALQGADKRAMAELPLSLYNMRRPATQAADPIKAWRTHSEDAHPGRLRPVVLEPAKNMGSVEATKIVSLTHTLFCWCKRHGGIP